MPKTKRVANTVTLIGRIKAMTDDEVRRVMIYGDDARERRIAAEIHLRRLG